MGIDIHSLNFLKYTTKKHGNLKNTLTLGRLVVFLGPNALKKYTGTSKPSYAEDLLSKYFGATIVESIDNSNYEGATIIADMNKPTPKALDEKFDCILDFGTTEHIFDIAQAHRNMQSMCKSGGLILHASPANNFCGHGFYQFSPELFLSRYSPENGFKDTEVFLADACDIKNWYRVLRSRTGERINIRSTGEIFTLVVTRIAAKSAERVQQSDYEFEWSNNSSDAYIPHKPGRLAWLREILFNFKFTAKATYLFDSLIAKQGAKTLKNHRLLERVKIKDII